MTEYQKRRFVQMSEYDEVRYCQEMTEYRNVRANYKRQIRLRCRNQVPFSEHEDHQLLKVLEIFDGERKKIDKVHRKKLVDNLGRDWETIYERLRSTTLQRAGGTIKFKTAEFSLEEDMLIMDCAMSELLTGKVLKETKISNVSHIAESLKRHHSTVQHRWKSFIRTWLLQYYAKTLNFEIRPMLAKVLADNFKSLKTVDWDFVLKYPEFSGHTANSLRSALSCLEKVLHRKLGVKRSDLSLKQISEFAQENYKPRKVSKKTEKRQQELIAYFEKNVKQNNITNFI